MRKLKFLLSSLIVFVMTAQSVFAGAIPPTFFKPSGSGLVSTTVYDEVGTLAAPWAKGYFSQLCIAGVCESAWPAIAWGSITGTLSDQTDLQNALDLKAPLASPAFTTQATLSKLGTASVGNPVYNSADLILESSAWDTDNARADTWYYKLRNKSGSGTTTNANLYLYAQSVIDGVPGAETQLGYFDALGRPVFSGFLASGSTGFVGNMLYPYNSTFLTLKGRITHSATGQAIKIFGGTAAGSPTLGEQLLSYYAGNGDFQVGGIDALDGFSFQRTGTKQTTDGTQQAITGGGAVLTTTTGQIYQVRAMVVGKQGTTNVAGAEIVATVRNVGGTASIVGAVQQVAPNQSAGDWGSAGVFATFTVSGADVRVSVQGKAATTIDWRMQMDYITY